MKNVISEVKTPEVNTGFAGLKDAVTDLFLKVQSTKCAPEIHKIGL